MAGINKVLYNTEDRMLTKEDIIKHLHLKSAREFYDLVHRQNIPHLKVGKRILIPESVYSKWVENNLQKRV